MSIESEILRIQQAKTNLKVSINAKGGTIADESIEEYAQAIDNLPSGSGGGMTYEDYARTLYLGWGKSNQFASAWAHSLTVDPLEISSGFGEPGVGPGTMQYPNGDTEGVIIPQGTTSIAFMAFNRSMTNNQPLVIPDSVTSIGEDSFSNWYSNKQPLVIPNSVKSIGDFAFSGWMTNNQPLVIPNSVTSIGFQAFGEWMAVPYVEIQAVTPPTLGHANAFSSQNNAPIYVPDASVTAYKTATNWVSLASRIFSINDK